jgi:hypothetical protein
MNKYNKLILAGAALALFTNVSMATSCPDISNYSLTSHDQNNRNCTYTSSARGSIGLNGTRAVQNCPRFILTDPNFRQVGICRVVIRSANLNINHNNNRNAAAGAAACQCTIRAAR